MASVRPDGKLNVEVAQRRKSTLKLEEIEMLVWPVLMNLSDKVPRTHKFDIPATGIVNDLAANIESIRICNEISEPVSKDNVNLFVYRIHEGGSFAQILDNGTPNGHDNFKNGDGDGSSADEQTAASNHWLLPARQFEGLWDSLYFEPNVKENLLSFVESSMLFAARNIDPHVISCNRLVLLHGPPGTGKTSLCQAIAQKLSVRWSGRFRFTHLIEINSHSLFSKWFSESGKLVLKLFDDIRRVLEHDGSLVCLLIDEVESIAFARGSVSASEPSDSLRVVNAVLTQLDQIRHHRNVLVLTTSNLTDSIDVAFIDRADIKQFIGHPTVEAIYAIYASSVRELIRAEIVQADGLELLTYQQALCANSTDGQEQLMHELPQSAERSSVLSGHLLMLARQSAGLSGRTLRKLPFLAHALHLSDECVPIDVYVRALGDALNQHRADSERL